MFDLLPYNTFGLDVKAYAGIIVRSVSDLKTVSAPETLILGLGSDVLFIDDYEGLAVINAIKGLEIVKTGRTYQVTAGGGVVLDEFIQALLSYGITGLENLSGIPGTVGAAPVQNIGAYGREIGSFITGVEVYDLDTHRAFTLSHDECAFAYRTSVFKEQKQRRYFITHVHFAFEEGFKPCLTYPGLDNDPSLTSAGAVRHRVLALRERKLPDPRFVGNAGSFFKNPVVDADKVATLKETWPDLPVYPTADGKFKLAAGYLIDKAGCRGITHGHAGTWEHQALVIVNRGQACPHEIVSLARYIAARVEELFKVTLIPEVRIFGRHGEVPWERV